MADRTMAHWRVLAALGMINWGVYFIYDIPASLSTPLSKHLSYSDHQTAYLVSLLYSVYSVPNTVLPFLAGTAVQRFGERALLIGIVSSVALGQLLFAVAVQTKIEFGMIIGRAFIGLGGEVVAVLGCEIITRWFQHNRLSLALAINLCLARLGSVSNSIIIPTSIEPCGIVAVTWFATLLSLGMPIIGLVSLLATPDPATEADESLLIPEPPGTILPTKHISATSSLRHFPRVFWHLAIICLLSYSCINTFTNSAQRLLTTRFYDDDQAAAGEAVSILFILSGFLVPPFGFLLDALDSSGYPRALTTSNALLCLAHGIFLMCSVSSPVVPLCLLGAADALLGVAFWGSVTRCLLSVASEIQGEAEPHYHGNCNTTHKDELVQLLSEDPEISSISIEEAAIPNITPMHGEALRTLGIGIMASLMNICTTIVPVFLAFVENAEGFIGLEFVFLALALLGCVACVRLAWTWEL
ncbi:major facilitator superfamily domain-containing protein [Aspergillus insuetus]